MSRGQRAMAVDVGRIYDDERGGGQRVLVDRLWPRGMSHERADVTWWCREVAPSTALRRWYGHDPDRFAEFARRYRAELAEPERAAAVQRLHELAAEQPVLLLTATRAVEISAAQVLADVLAGG